MPGSRPRESGRTSFLFAAMWRGCLAALVASARVLRLPDAAPLVARTGRWLV